MTYGEILVPCVVDGSRQTVDSIIEKKNDDKLCIMVVRNSFTNDSLNIHISFALKPCSMLISDRLGINFPLLYVVPTLYRKSFSV